MKIETKISVCLATFNEEESLGSCLDSVKELAEEIVIVDGTSTDRTREIAERFGAKIIVTDNPPIFHINKQKALAACKNDWILQLDADERVSEKLAVEIKKVVEMSDEEIEKYQKELPKRDLFLRHQRILESRDGNIGTSSGPYSAFFVPRLNYFLGKYLKYGGVYPDGVIRLLKKGRAYFPAKSVHEQIVVDGRVGWLQSDLIHFSDLTFKRYLKRNNRYINLITDELRRGNVNKNLTGAVSYFLTKPTWWFFKTQIRHKGILDGFQGIVFSFFSALRFPRAYWRYLRIKHG